MRWPPFCEDYGVSSARASAGACCCVLFRVVAVVAILTTGASSLPRTVASATEPVGRVAKSTGKTALAASIRTTRSAGNTGFHSSGEPLWISCYVSYRKGYKSDCTGSNIHSDLEAKSGDSAVDRRRLSAMSREGDPSETKGTVTAVSNGTDFLEDFSSLYTHRDSRRHTNEESLVETGLSALPVRRFRQAAAREEDATVTGLTGVAHESSTGEAADDQGEWNNSAKCLQAAFTTNGAAMAGAAAAGREAGSAFDGGRGCSRTALGSKQDILERLFAKNVVTLRDSTHASVAKTTLKPLEHGQSPAQGSKDLMGYAGGNYLPSEDVRHFRDAEPRLELLVNNQYSLARRGSGEADRRGVAPLKETLHRNVSNVGLEHVHIKLAHLSRGVQTDDGSSNNLIETLKEEIRNLFETINKTTLLCEAERISKAMQFQHHNSNHSDLDIAAFKDGSTRTFTTQVKKADVYSTDDPTRRSRDVQILEALEPSVVALAETDIITSVQDALSEASTLVEKLRRKPPQSVAWEAVRKLEVRVRALHAATGRFKHVLHAIRAAVRLSLQECPGLAKKVGQKGGVSSVTRKVTSRLFSAVKYTHTACKTLSSTIALFLPLQLQQADLSLEDELRLTTYFGSVTEALDTAWQRAASTKVYNEQLVITLLTVATSAPQSVIARAEATKDADASTRRSWKTLVP